MSIKIGVIGVGYLGQHHARVLASLQGVELSGVADLDSCRAEEIGKKHGCDSCTDFSDLIRRSDALSIVTPTTTHHAIAMECIEQGKDIFVEKPITENTADARELIAKAAAKGLVLQVGHIERFNPAIMALDGMLGTPRFVEAERLSPFLGRAMDVDVTYDLMIHDIDIILSIVKSKISDIRAVGDRVLTGKVDAAKAWLEFENGAKALVTASRLAAEKSRTLRIHQADSYISVDYQTLEIRKYVRNGSGISFDAIKAEPREQLLSELEEFVDCIRTRRRPRVSGEEALAALEAVERITRAVGP